MDCAKGFWSIRLDEEGIPLIAFLTNYGTYEWTRLPFGIADGSSAYTRAMSMVLEGLVWNNVNFFIDDIIFADGTIDEHASNLQKVLQRFRDQGVKISVEKSLFLAQKAKILGHIVTPNGLEADPEKLASIINMPPPKDKKGVLTFLGCIGYMRKFIKGYAYLVHDISILTRKNEHFRWNKPQQEAFQ